MTRQRVRLTSRGRWALGWACVALGAAVGYLTANWCWYGYCGL